MKKNKNRAMQSKRRQSKDLAKLPTNCELKILRKLVSLTSNAGFPVPIEFHQALRSGDLFRVLEAGSSWSIQKYLPSERECPDSIAVRHLVTSFLRKFDAPSSSEDLKLKALDSVRGCERANSRFNTSGYKRLYDESGDLHPLVKRAQVICSSIYGTPSWDRLFRDSRHGPGSSTSHRLWRAARILSTKSYRTR